jgi:hypothetical protein
MEFKTKESAEDYIANMIDWDMLVTIVGQLSEHIAEKKVNEISTLQKKKETNINE